MSRSGCAEDRLVRLLATRGPLRRSAIRQHLKGVLMEEDEQLDALLARVCVREEDGAYTQRSGGEMLPPPPPQHETPSSMPPPPLPPPKSTAAPSTSVPWSGGYMPPSSAGCMAPTAEPSGTKVNLRERVVNAASWYPPDIEGAVDVSSVPRDAGSEGYFQEVVRAAGWQLPPPSETGLPADFRITGTESYLAAVRLYAALRPVLPAHTSLLRTASVAGPAALPLSLLPSLHRLHTVTLRLASALDSLSCSIQEYTASVRAEH